MKKQRKMTSIAASIAMMAVSALSVGGATFAWFTRGTTAQATGFDFTAAAASGIQISTDAVTWKSSIAATDFDVTTSGGAQEGNRVSVDEMEPISTQDVVAAGTYTFWRATYGDGDYTIAQDTENYLVFDLYFLNEGAYALTLMLTSASTVTDGDNTDKDTALATRVAFVVEGNSDVPATVIAANGGDSGYIWEPNSLTRSQAAIGKGAESNAKYEYNALTANNGNEAVSALDSYGYLSENAGYTANVSTTHDHAIGDEDAIAQLPGSSQITKVKVFVWIEGQDVDCNNGTSAGDVDIDFQFDSAAATGTSEAVLADKTSDTLSAEAVTLTGTGDAGAKYNAFVVLNDTDSAVSLDYRKVVSTGEATHSGVDVTSITLAPAVVAGTYDVVVVGTFEGHISSRTSTSETLV